MTALLAFLAAASVNPIFHPKFAPVIVGVANKYFHQPVRLIFEKTNDPYSVFASEAVKGHKAPIIIEKFSLPSMKDIKQKVRGNCDILVFLGPSSNLPSENEWKKLRWSPGGRVIVMVEADSARALRIIRGIWERTSTKNVLVAAINNNALEFYQWTPYRTGECSNVMTVDLIDKWENGKFSRNASFYLNTALKSLNGCDLLFTTSEAYPYVLNNFTAGIEIHLFNILAKCFNFVPRFVEIAESKSIWQTKIYNGRDWTFTGPLKLLYEHKLDVLFAGMSAHIDRYAASSPTFPHMVESILWTVPAPRVESPIQNAFRALSPSSWFMIILSLFLGSLAVYITHDPQCPTYRSSFFYTLGALLNGMPSFKTNNWYLRIITAGIIILAMHFFIAYQSSLILLLTTPVFEKPYSTLQDVMKANLTCYSYSAGARLLRLDPDSSIPKNFYTMNESSPNYFHEIAYNRTAYLLLPRLPTYHTTWRKFEDNKGRNLLQQLETPFMVLPISFHLAPGHPLAPLISKKIIRMLECGIVAYWIDMSNEMKFSSSDRKVQIKLQPLSDYHLTGAFTVVVLALSASLLVFIIEILTAKFVIRRTVSIDRIKKLSALNY